MGILHRVAFFFTLLSFVLLAGSMLATWVHPEEMVFPSFLGIAFPYLWLANLIWLIYWLFFLRWKIVFPIVALVFTYPSLGKVLKLWGNLPNIAKENNGIKVMTFNARLFGLADKKVDTGPFFEWLAKENPDILCFQEFMWEETKRRNYIRKTEKATGIYTYRFSRAYRAMDSLHRDYGTMIFSRFPIIAEGELVFARRSTNRCQWVDVVREDDTLRIINVHLQSYKFGKDEYNFIAEGNEQNTDVALSRGAGLFSKMAYAWKVRGRQADEVATLIQSSPFPVLVCGDFNDTPISYAYARLSEGLKDAFREAGWGLGATYLGQMPNFRIDYIFYHSKWVCREFFSVDKEKTLFSDHRALVSTLHLP